MCGSHGRREEGGEIRPPSSTPSHTACCHWDIRGLWSFHNVLSEGAGETHFASHRWTSFDPVPSTKAVGSGAARKRSSSAGVVCQLSDSFSPHVANQTWPVKTIIVKFILFSMSWVRCWKTLSIIGHSLIAAINACGVTVIRDICFLMIRARNYNILLVYSMFPTWRVALSSRRFLMLLAVPCIS